MSSGVAKVATHTPLPWKLGTVKTSIGLCHKIGPFPPLRPGEEPSHACIYVDGRYKPEHDPESLANAQFIVTACNSHYELLEACRDAILLAHPCPECGQVELLGEGLARCPCADRPWDWRDIKPVKDGWQGCYEAIAKATGGHP